MLLTGTPVTTLRPRRGSPRKRRFDRKAQNDLRQLLAALREIGDRPNLEQILLRYEVRRDRLTSFVKKIEAEALIEESLCQA
ncbi:MAG TPA: hypothetical protein VN229_22025 [Terriglobales bacterium]|nr:hypothetical protein [Terriglobales bacterium]